MKYNLSLCCIIKNERYLEEFINYYILLGVEHFYIYDNESSIPILERLNNFYYNKICTIINFPGKGLQLEAYKNCLDIYGEDTKWLIFCDGDEYILPKNHYKLIDFLNEYDDAHAIAINWIMYGTSFHEYKKDGFLIDKYRYCNKFQDKHIKTICKPKFTIKFNNPHHVIVSDPLKYLDSHRNIIDGPWNTNFNTDIIQINHYFGRSIEENIEKHHRGNADSIDGKYIIPKNLHKYNNDQYSDLICKKYLNDLIKLTRIIGANYLIYKSLNPDLEKLNIEETYNHIYKYAFDENRLIHINDKYPNFSKDIYRKNYKILSYLDDLHLELYYINKGSKENHVCDRLI
jgi:hypothetical protein